MIGSLELFFQQAAGLEIVHEILDTQVRQF
jgi:hypothetical protein